MSSQPFTVFVHDLGQTPLQWEDVIVALPPDQGAVCPWLAGTRPGGAPGAPFTISGAAAGLLTAMDEHGARTATIVGVGLGGTVALQAAAIDPERVERVVVLSGVAQPSRRALAAQRATVRIIPAGTWAARNIDKERLLAALQQQALDSTADTLKDLATPVLLVAGEHDRPGCGQAAVLAGTLPHAEVRILPGVDKDLPRTAAAAVSELVYGVGMPPDPFAEPDPGLDRP